MSASYPTAPRATSPRAAGAYLQLRRRHAGLTRRRVADLMNETPASSDATRQQLVHFEETGEMLPGFNIALHHMLPLLDLDRTVLEALALDLPAPQFCRTCGCSHSTPCNTGTWHTCHWVEGDLCSYCAPASAKKEKAHA